MTNTATIKYDTEIYGWPGDAALVQLAPALRRYDVKTGEPVDYEHVVAVVKTPTLFRDQAGVDFFAADEDGAALLPTMIPLDQQPYAALHSAIKRLGYEPTN